MITEVSDKCLIGATFHQLELGSTHSIVFSARKGDTLHFIEVKTRRSTKFGNPEESINKQKMRNLKDAAEQYQHLNPGWKWIQFDVLAILFKEDSVDYWFNQDVYL